MSDPIKQLFVAAAVCVSAYAFAAPVFAAEPLGWVEITGDTVNVYYLPGANLKKIESRLRYRYVPVSPEFRALLENKEYPIERRIGARFQFILMRVEEVLNMHPSIPQLRVRVFRLREQMRTECASLLGVNDFKSFYMHSRRTVFTSEQDIIDSVIAHEFGHAVVDHYFSVSPPQKVTELLACYADEHLDRD